MESVLQQISQKNYILPKPMQEVVKIVKLIQIEQNIIYVCLEQPLLHMLVIVLISTGLVALGGQQSAGEFLRKKRSLVQERGN